MRHRFFFVTPMRSSGSRVDIAQKPNKNGQILDQRWKLFFVIFTKLIPRRIFFLYCKNVGVDGKEFPRFFLRDQGNPKHQGMEDQGREPGRRSPWAQSEKVSKSPEKMENFSNQNCLQWGRSNLVDPAGSPKIRLLNRDFGNILSIFPRKISKKKQSSLNFL